MSLKLRSTGLGHVVYKDVPDSVSTAASGASAASISLGLGLPDTHGFGRCMLDHADLEPGRVTGGRQGRVRGELEAVEVVGGDGRSAVASVA